MEPPGGLVIGNKLILKSYHAWKNRFGQVMGSKPVQTNTLFPVIHQEKYFPAGKNTLFPIHIRKNTFPAGKNTLFPTTHQEKYFPRRPYIRKNTLYSFPEFLIVITKNNFVCMKSIMEKRKNSTSFPTNTSRKIPRRFTKTRIFLFSYYIINYFSFHVFIFFFF
ncbi:hypothetical protein RhiirA4_121940 [Rhizophagus irregularis]|uniref:Uncharacterized protein n=1 Tax=Rhizophagus irregularis TaxID=588596 RepID=A0A2I1HFI7_9GLOM|nr:hypothetical protein RhiirA4_121940 [Rhizophagus irregularis]